MAFDQGVGKNIESSQCQGTETGLGKEFEMGFIRHHTAEQQVVSWTEQEVAGQIGNEVCAGTERAGESVSGHRGPRLEQGRRQGVWVATGKWALEEKEQEHSALGG